MLTKENAVEKYSCISHFRDLLNIAQLIDYEEELVKAEKLLRSVGWADNLIQDMKTTATFNTRYEVLIPHTMKQNGDYQEYLKNKSHFTK